MLSRTPIAALMVLGALGLAACGDDDGGVASGAAEDAGGARAALEHIHGLGVDPRDRTLFIATHNGLFRAAEGQSSVQQVGDVTQDIMGFSVVGAGHYIGSGHPSLAQDQPPHLGLIESRDGGRTWTNVSLLGKADFHVLRSAGARVYGFDGLEGRLMVSSDGGRTWERRNTPGAVFDLAIDPGNHDRIVVSIEQGIFSSSNAGLTWRPVSAGLAGLLAWPEGDRIYLVDSEGQVLESTDRGRRFDVVGSAGGPPNAFSAAGEDLYVALGDGTVKRSSDGGETWAVRTLP